MFLAVQKCMWPSQGLSIIQSTVFYLQTDNPIKKSTLRVLFFIDGAEEWLEAPMESAVATSWATWVAAGILARVPARDGAGITCGAGRPQTPSTRLFQRCSTARSW
ncbi:hypothetical protein CT3_04560 [Comamonas terrigena NBRC 13299]|nr:hypothetical protein CT3_04560 [Comamonas terrigena NBRC 13299]